MKSTILDVELNIPDVYSIIRELLMKGNNGVEYFETIETYPITDDGIGCELETSLYPHIEDNTLIMGGHWIPDYKKLKIGILTEPDTVSKFSFKSAVKLYARAKNEYNAVELALLIGDLTYGADCCYGGANEIDKQKRRKENHETFLREFLEKHIPEEYSKILKEYGIDKEELIIISEKDIRQRGDYILNYLKSLDMLEKRKKMQGNCEQHDYWLDFLGIKMIGVEKKNRMRPKCALIQAALSNFIRIDEVGYDRILEIKNSESYKCDGKYGDLYHMLFPFLLELYDGVGTPIDIISTSVKFKIEIPNKITATKRLWIPTNKYETLMWQLKQIDSTFLEECIELLNCMGPGLSKRRDGSESI